MRYLTLSFLLHSVLFFLIMTSTLFRQSGGSGGSGTDKQGEEQGGGLEGINGEIMAKPAEAVVSTKDIEEAIRKQDKAMELALEQEMARKQQSKIDDCSLYYGGIGVTISTGGKVEGVYEGYPAYEAGIMSGDIILNHREILGEPNTPVKLILQRNGYVDTVILMRGKICLTSGGD